VLTSVIKTSCHCQARVQHETLTLPALVCTFFRLYEGV
jgi:hypothetical protein